MTSINTTINFGKGEGEAVEEEKDELSLSITCEESGCEFGVDVKFRVYSSPAALFYKKKSTDGTMSPEDNRGTLVKKTATETINFLMDSSTSISGDGRGDFKIKDVNYHDDGKPSVFIENGEIKSAAPFMGSVTFEYTESYKEYTINVSRPEGYDSEENPGHNVSIVAYSEEYDLKDSLGLTFKEREEDEEEEGEEEREDDDAFDIQLSIGLDEESNDGKTEFWLEDRPTLFVRADFSKPYGVGSNAGNITRIRSGIVRVVKEDLSFSASDKASMSQVPLGAPTKFLWTQTSKKALPVFNGKYIYLPETVTGTMAVEYNILVDLYQLAVDTHPESPGAKEAFDVECTLTQEGEVAACSVPYNKDEEEEEPLDPEIEIYLDEDLNGGKSKFWINDQVRLCVIPTLGIDYGVEPMWGNCYLLIRDYTVKKEVSVSFEYQDVATLPDSPGGPISYEWGNSSAKPPPSFVGNQVRLNRKVIGVLVVSYTLKRDLWQFTLNSAPPVEDPDSFSVKAVAHQLDARSSCDISFEKPEGEDGEDPDEDSDEDDDETGDEVEDSIEVTLASELNGKETFTTNDKPKLKVEANPNKPYEVVPMTGSVRMTNEKFEIEVKETLSFKSTSSASLSQVPSGSVSFEWGITSASPEPLLTNDTQVTLGEEVIGSLTATYTVKRDIWELTVTEAPPGADPEKFDVPVVGAQGEARSTCDVPYEDEESEDEEAPQKYQLMVVDYKSGEPVPGANVQFGAMSFQVGSGGTYDLGELTKGEYPTVVTKDGYIPSPEDRLANDLVTI